MTVADLVRALQQLDPAAPVVVYSPDPRCDYLDVDELRVRTATQDSPGAGPWRQSNGADAREVVLLR